MSYIDQTMDRDDDSGYPSKEEMGHTEEWSPPEEREAALKELKETVDENKKYHFSHEGLFEKIQKHIN